MDHSRQGELHSPLLTRGFILTLQAFHFHIERQSQNLLCTSTAPSVFRGKAENFRITVSHLCQGKHLPPLSTSHRVRCIFSNNPVSSLDQRSAELPTPVLSHCHRVKHPLQNCVKWGGDEIRTEQDTEKPSGYPKWDSSRWEVVR